MDIKQEIKSFRIINFFKNQEHDDAIRAFYKRKNLVYYTPLEEFFNVLTHFAGFVFGIVAMVLMAVWASTPIESAVAFLCPIGFLVVYFNSCLYHITANINHKSFFRQLDYASINTLVVSCGAGIYLLNNSIFGYVSYGISILLTIIVVFLCFFKFDDWTRYFTVFSNFVIGSLSFVCFLSLISQLSTTIIALFFVGLILCLCGSVLFGIKKRYVHALFHLLVLAGPIFMFTSNFLMFIAFIR